MPIVQATYKYDPYGTSLGTTGSISNPIRFNGGYYDASTALYKFGVRYYNSVDARWTQLDPSGQNPGYVFAGDDPVNQVDPNGTFSFNNFLSHYYGGYCHAGFLLGDTAVGVGLLFAPLSFGTSLAVGVGVVGITTVAESQVCGS